MAARKTISALLKHGTKTYEKNNGQTFLRTSSTQNQLYREHSFDSNNHSYNHSNNHSNNHRRYFWGLIPAGALLGSYLTSQYEANAAEPDPRSPFIGGRSPNLGRGSRRSNNFIADVVDTTGSAVVYIERLKNIPFTRHAVPVSNGSGFIVDAKGVIVTNAHVVANQSNLQVRLQDGREFEGHVIGIDEARDIAAIKIECNRLPTIPLGRSDDLRPGEWVVAMGSPLALKNTVTAGIISNVSRRGEELGVRQRGGEMEYIQTDATINVGNSGGPLVNLDGEVIGINTMMAGAGIGFAIPVNCVKDFLRNVPLGGTGRSSTTPYRVTPPTRRWIGITMLTLTPDICAQLRLRNPGFPAGVTEGVLVHQVQTHSPAFHSGIQDGDVIISINGNAVRSTADVFNVLKQQKSLTVTVRRRSATMVMRVEAEDVTV